VIEQRQVVGVVDVLSGQAGQLREINDRDGVSEGAAGWSVVGEIGRQGDGRQQLGKPEHRAGLSERLLLLHGYRRYQTIAAEAGCWRLTFSSEAARCASGNVEEIDRTVDLPVPAEP